MGMENQIDGAATAEKVELRTAKNVEDLIKFAQKAEERFRKQMCRDGQFYRRVNERLQRTLWPGIELFQPTPETLPTPVWFRGQPLCGEGLISKCRRQAHKHVAQDENNILVHFMLGAHARSGEPLPAEDDYAGWLALAQHHGLPTRLLDWSGSILVAAFFATQERDNEDGIIYSLSPALVNAELGEYIGPSQLVMNNKATTVNILRERFDVLTNDERSKAVAYTNQCLKDRTLTQEAANRLWPVLMNAEMTELIAGAFGASDSTNFKILAAGPRQTTRRIIQQLGFFTIHGGASKPLEKDPHKNDFLLEITIPAAEKKNIRNQLRLLGITRSYLFPDLDNLAKEIADDFTSNSCPS